MSKPTRRLGRGLDTLVSDLRPAKDARTAAVPDQAQPAPEPRRQPLTSTLDIHSLSPNPYQPRRAASDLGLISLAESLRNSGMLQPISVREHGGKYQIIAGERRWRAAELAGLKTVPVIVRQADDRDMLEMALIENIQREDLNAIDRARAYRQYCDRFDMTAEDVARRLGEDRSTASNYLRLLDLDDEIQGMVGAGKMAMGHARCIVGLPDPADRLRLARAVVAHDLSVRALEEIVRRQKRGQHRAGASAARPSEKTPHLRDLEERLSVATGTKATIQEGRRKGSGRIVIEYYSLDDFDRITAMLNLDRQQ